MPTEIKRLFVRNLSAAAFGASLIYDQGLFRQALVDLGREQFNAIKSGRIPQTVSGNGYTASYGNFSELNGYSPIELAELSDELLRRYDDCKTWLENCALYGLDPDDVLAAGDFSGFTLTEVETPSTVTEDTIAAYMLLLLQPVTEVGYDYRELIK